MYTSPLNPLFRILSQSLVALKVDEVDTEKNQEADHDRYEHKPSFTAWNAMLAEDDGVGVKITVKHNIYNCNDISKRSHPAGNDPAHTE